MKNNRKSKFITPNLNFVQFPQSRTLENILTFWIFGQKYYLLWIQDISLHFRVNCKLPVLSIDVLHYFCHGCDYMSATPYSINYNKYII